MSNIPSGSGTIPISHFNVGSEPSRIQGIKLNQFDDKQAARTGTSATRENYPELRNQFLTSVQGVFGQEVREKLEQTFPEELVAVNVPLVQEENPNQENHIEELHDQEVPQDNLNQPQVEVQQNPPNLDRIFLQKRAQMSRVVEHYKTFEKKFAKALDKQIDTSLKSFRPALGKEEQEWIKSNLLSEYRANPAKLAQLFNSYPPLQIEGTAMGEQDLPQSMDQAIAQYLGDIGQNIQAKHDQFSDRFNFGGSDFSINIGVEGQSRPDVGNRVLEGFEFRRALESELITEVETAIKEDVDALLQHDGREDGPKFFLESLKSSVLPPNNNLGGNEQAQNDQPPPDVRTDFLGWAKDNINFAKLGDYGRSDLNRRVGFTIDGGPKVTDQWWGNNDMAGRQAQSENKLVNLAFKDFILREYGPYAANVMWGEHSELDSHLQAGGHILRSDIKRFIAQASELSAHSHFIGKPWANGFPPTQAQDYTRARFQAPTSRLGPIDIDRVNTLDRELNASNSGRISNAPQEVREIKDKKLREKCENKTAILDFMDFLEKKGVSVSSRNAIWKEHFEEGFTTGSKELTYKEARVIFQEAKDLDKAGNPGELERPQLMGNVRNQLLERLGNNQVRDQDKIAVSGRLGLFRYGLAKLMPGTGNPKVPQAAGQAEANRAEIFQVMNYLTAKYGPSVAEEVWKTKLEYRAEVGLGLGTWELMQIDREASKSGASLLESAYNQINVFIEREMTNTRAVREELGFSRDAMRWLRCDFSLRARAEVSLNPPGTKAELGKLDDKLKNLAEQCIGQLRLVTGQNEPIPPQQIQGVPVLNQNQGIPILNEDVPVLNENEGVPIPNLNAPILPQQNQGEIVPNQDQDVLIEEHVEEVNPNLQVEGNVGENLHVEIQVENQPPPLQNNEQQPQPQNRFPHELRPQSYVKSIRKGFAERKVNPVGSWWSLMGADQKKDIFKSIKKLADTAEIGVLLKEDGLTSFLEAGGKESKMPELGKGTQGFVNAMGWLQYAGMGEYILGIYAEAKSFNEVREKNEDIENNLQLASSNLQLQMKLLGLFREIDAKYDNYSNPEHADYIEGLPPKNEIELQIDSLEKKVVETENKLATAFSKSPDSAQAKLHLIQGLRYVASLTGVSLQLVSQILTTFGLTASAIGTVGTVGGQIGGVASIVALGTSTYRTVRDFQGATRCYRAGKRSDEVLKEQFSTFTGFVNNVENGPIRIRKSDSSLLSKEKVELSFDSLQEFNDNIRNFRPGGDDDPLLQSHLRYRAYKKSKKLVGANKLELNQKNLITRDLRTDFTKAISRNQRTGEKAWGGVRNGVNTVAYAGSAAAIILPYVKGGAAVGGIAGTATVPVIGTAIGSILGATFGLVSGVMTFGLHFAYKKYKVTKQAEKIQGWSQALSHKEGPMWMPMKKAGLTDDQAQELALRKLIRRDPKMALTEMSKLIVAEKGRQPQPVTEMLKNGFKPQTNPKTESDRLKNAKWSSTIDRLAEFTKPEEIQAFLDPILRPA